MGIEILLKIFRVQLFQRMRLMPSDADLEFRPPETTATNTLAFQSESWEQDSSESHQRTYVLSKPQDLGHQL